MSKHKPRFPSRFQDTPKELRPVGARALKSATDTLRPYLYDARVLDLFAGQGRFGIAAIEEGAAVACFVEKDARTAAALKREIARYQNARVETTEAMGYLAFLAHRDERFDIIFADPPFPLWSPELAERLFASVAKVAAKGAIFLVKHPKRVVPFSPADGDWQTWKQTPFGESRLMYYRYGQGEENTGR